MEEIINNIQEKIEAYVAALKEKGQDILGEGEFVQGLARRVENVDV